MRQNRSIVWIGCLAVAVGLTPLARAEDPNFQKGLEAFKKGDWATAIRRYTAVIEANNKNAVAYYNRGLAYSRTNKFDAALSDYTNAIRLRANFVLAYQNRALVYVAKRDGRRALADWNRAIQLAPRYAPAYVGRGNLSYQYKKYDEAIADYTSALRINPRLPSAFHARALVYHYAKKDYRKALADYNAAVLYERNNARYLFDRGILYHYALKDLDRALADYNAATLKAPRYAAAYYQAGLALEGKRDWNNAILSYTRAILSNSKFAEAHARRCYAFLWQFKDDNARRDYDVAVKLMPSWSSTLGKTWKDIVARRKRSTGVVVTADPVLAADLKALQGEWNLVPGKNPKGITMNLVIKGKGLSLSEKSRGFDGINSFGFDLGRAGKERFIQASLTKWPYTLERDTLTLTEQGKTWVFARSTKKSKP